MARIEFTDADGHLKRFEIPATAAGIVIGRSPACNVVLPSQSVGRNHGRITCEGGTFAYTDLGSMNGSFINDQKAVGTTRLKDGDTIRCGDVVLRFFVGTRQPTGQVPVPQRPPADRTMREDEGLAPVRATGGIATARRPSAAGGLPPTVPAPAVPEKGQPARPVTDAVALAELARLRKENAALRAEVQALQGRLAAGAADAPDVAVLRRQLEEARAAAGGNDEELKRLRAAVAEAERHAKEAENRAAMASSSLESIHSKYMEAREESRHVSSLLERARNEAQDREIEVMELREKVAELTRQIESTRGRGVEAAEEVKGLKVKLTEKDREIEGLRRELDSREYDLRALREENERLEEYCQSDSGRQQQLERKVRNLEAVIEENRSLIAELRRTLEEKDRELREVRLGVGIADLEQEKQRLLDDYHKKSRELDALRAGLASARADLEGAAAEREALQGRIRQLEEAARTRRSEREDISDHPAFRAKVREAEGLVEALAERDRAIEQLRREVKEGSEALAAAIARAEAAASARAEAAAAASAANARAEAAEAAAAAAAANARAEAAAAAAAAAARERQSVPDAAIGEAVESLLDSLVLLQSGMRDVEAALANAGASRSAEMEEAVASVRDLGRIVAGEAQALRARLRKGEEAN